jgi:broad specificity phosphatase PhoE
MKTALQTLAICYCLLIIHTAVAMSESTQSTEKKKIVTKTIYLIRHAESEENERTQSLTNVVRTLSSFKLPSSKEVSESLQLLNVYSQVDSGVSAAGAQQILDMADTLTKEDFLKLKDVNLVMHSPLQRARETSRGLLQCLAGSDTVEELRHQSVTRVIESPILVERTPSEWLPGKFEGYRQRILQWEQFALEQPEQRIAVVGHSQFFKTMLNLDFKFGNCHVWEAQLSSEAKDCEAADAEFPTLSPQWSGLKQLYGRADQNIPKSAS